MKIILASNSPRRKELLEQVGIEYTVMPADVDEKIDIDNPADIVLELSDRKSGYICEHLKDTDEEFCVIGADTVVACDGMVLGKPKDKEDACLVKMIENKKKLQPGVIEVPKEIDEAVAVRKLSSLGIKIDKLTESQKKYLGM